MKMRSPAEKSKHDKTERTAEGYYVQLLMDKRLQHEEENFLDVESFTTNYRIFSKGRDVHVITSEQSQGSTVNEYNLYYKFRGDDNQDIYGLFSYDSLDIPETIRDDVSENLMNYCQNSFQKLNLEKFVDNMRDLQKVVNVENVNENGYEAIYQKLGVKPELSPEVIKEREQDLINELELEELQQLNVLER